jgi:iron complex transport system substrate-binding protein
VVRPFGLGQISPVGILPALLLTACASQPAIPRNAIISNNPCIDAVLAEIAAPGQIGAVSAWSHDPASASAPLPWARQFPAVGTSAEDLILARPRLVLTGDLASGGTNAALARAGVRTVSIGVAANVRESEAQVMQIARAIGREGQGAALVGRIEGAVRCSRLPVTPACAGVTKPATAIIWLASGFAPGSGTLQDELLRRAGFRNASATYGLKQWDVLPMEALLRRPPDVIFTPVSAGGEEGRALSMRMRLLGRLKPRPRIVPFPEKLLNCGGPTIIKAMAIMKAAR